MKSSFETYKSLWVLFGFVLLVSGAGQVSLGYFDPHLFMNHLMAGFFIGLSFFKFLDLKGFAESFSGYDPIARRWRGYGVLYPFVELTLGLLFISGIALPIANGVTLAILSVTTVGVYQKLQSKGDFQCACAGTSFNLPLSWVTIAENVVMCGMAIWGLL